MTVTRQWVIDALVENIEICLGRRPVKLMLTIWRNEFGKKIPKHIEIEVSMRDGHAANVALKMLGKEFGMFKGGSAPLPPVAIKSMTDAEAAILVASYLNRSPPEEQTPIEQAEEHHDL